MNGLLLLKGEVIVCLNMMTASRTVKGIKYQITRD